MKTINQSNIQTILLLVFFRKKTFVFLQLNLPKQKFFDLSFISNSYILRIFILVLMSKLVINPKLNCLLFSKNSISNTTIILVFFGL